MPSITALLNPEPQPCPNHPRMLAERFGVCCVCEMTTHRHLSGFRLFPAPPDKIWGNPQGRFVREDVDHDARECPPIYWEPRDE